MIISEIGYFLFKISSISFTCRLRPMILPSLSNNIVLGMKLIAYSLAGWLSHSCRSDTLVQVNPNFSIASVQLVELLSRETPIISNFLP